MRVHRLLVCLAALFFTAPTLAAEPLSPSPTPAAVDPAFALWLTQLKQEALANGISQQTLDAALTDFQPIPRVIELDQRQPEFVDTFWNYLDRRVDEKRLALGRDNLREQKKLLRKVQARYGIPATVLIAFWGMETHFGRSMGSFPTPAALATLAYNNRRSAFFRAELLQALTILEQKHLPAADMKGSWAGAMGQMQFMPSTFLRYAIDADGDGRKDIWHSLPDAFHSAAHYLRQSGWRPGEIWGREVRLPEGFDYDEARLDLKKSVNRWAKLGVRQASGKPLPKANVSGAIILPQGHGGPAFLVYRNFDVIMEWNRSINYALAIGHLADRLNGQPPLLLGRHADNQRLTREQFIEIQNMLGRLGFDPGEIDGVPGSKTRLAIRAYQKAAGLPVDGHASAGLLEYLHKAPAKGTPDS
ncbi:MAG: lytic murein transglycosylase [Pseudomonadota bacterium]|nr:lytic murein transglycosylase [Pseudomonadota bacterium]